MTDASIRILVRHNEENCGPYSVSDVNQLLRAGQLDVEDLAWVEGTPEWVELSSIAGVTAPPRQRRDASVSEKLILPAFLLAWFLGVVGAHRFYAGRIGSGIAMLLLTITGFGLIVTFIWVIVDLVILATGGFRDGDGKQMTKWT